MNQDPYSYNQPYNQPSDPGRGNGIASLVLGIISLLTTMWVALILGIIGLGLSVTSAKKVHQSG